MERFILVCDKAVTAEIGDTLHDVACWPVSNFLGFTDETTDSTKLTLMFKPMEESIGSDVDGCDNVVLTITDKTTGDPCRMGQRKTGSRKKAAI